MIHFHIREPIFHNRSISISRERVILAQKSEEMFLITIGHPTYPDQYVIDPAKILSIGKVLWAKGTELLNFPINEMEILKEEIKCSKTS